MRTPVVRIKLTERYLSLNVLSMCDLGSSISFADKSVVSKLQLQSWKESLSVAGIHGSQNVKTESHDSCFSSWEVSTIDNSAILWARETRVRLPDCGDTRVERPLPTFKELVKSDLQFTQDSFLDKIVTFIMLLNSRFQKTTLHYGQWHQRLAGP